MPPSDLAAKLDQIPKSSHIKSLIHGDLHANNIHVRGTQLILLDFGSVCEGPILADPAALEASIVLETGIECSRLGKLDDWMLFLSRQVYDKGWNTRQLQFETVADSNPLNRSMWSALRILRMHSRNAELNTGDYAAVLVAAFVRVCCFDDSSPAQRAEVAVRLYSIACEIVNAL
jgi:thiamine kinase-like enzyme